MKLEVIACTLDDIEKINKSKADRIEFCKDMEQGGLTPKFKKVKRALSLEKGKPINVMVRPNSKNYYYSCFAYLKMIIEVKRLSRTNVNGLVFGILNRKNNEVNVKRMKRLVKIAKKHNKKVTFHRAIDLVPNYDEALKTLNELGVDTILTTGGLTPIMNNLPTLQYLKDLKEVIVLGGSGIDERNVLEISKHVNQIHVGSAIRENGWASPVDIEKINKIKEIIK